MRKFALRVTNGPVLICLGPFNGYPHAPFNGRTVVAEIDGRSTVGKIECATRGPHAVIVPLDGSTPILAHKSRIRVHAVVRATINHV